MTTTGESAGAGVWWWPRRRSLALDVLLAFASAAECVIEAVAFARRSGLSPALPALAGLLVGAVLLVRRRWPVLVVLVAVAVAPAQLGVLLSVVGLYTLAESDVPRRITGVLTGMTALATFAVTLLQMRGDLGRSRYHAPTAALVLTSLLVALGMTAPPVLLGLYAGARRRLVESLRERADGLQRELSLLAERAAESAERARMQERTRIARDMHDVVAHRVSLMVVHASALQAVATRDPEQAARSAGLLGDLGRQALDELRQMLGVLRTGPGPASAEAADEAVPAQRQAPGGEYDGRAGGGLTRIAGGAPVGERAAGAVGGAGGAEGAVGAGGAGAVGVVPAAPEGAVLDMGGGGADGDGAARAGVDAGRGSGAGLGPVPGAAPETASGAAAPDGAADPGAAGPDAAGPCLDELDALVAASRVAGMDVLLTVEGARRPCHPGVEAAVYRVVQEALTNAHKHAPGAGTRVTLAFRADEVAVQIRNGPSGDAPTVRLPSGGNGLLGMRERVTALGGGFASGPTPEGGFRVSALLPSPSRSAAAG